MPVCLLTAEPFRQNCTNMLILCNKTDALPDELAGISPKMMVKKRLEVRELTARSNRTLTGRLTQS